MDRRSAGRNARPSPWAASSRPAVVQAGLIGHGWMKVWLPGLLAGREDAFVRAAPWRMPASCSDSCWWNAPWVRNRSRRRRSARWSSSRASSVSPCTTPGWTPRCRHRSTRCAVRPTSCSASRGRIVAAGDQARRTIERNLHDGAQQHLVALAVQLEARPIADGPRSRAGQGRRSTACPTQVQDTIAGTPRPRARHLSAAPRRQGPARRAGVGGAGARCSRSRWMTPRPRPVSGRGGGHRLLLRARGPAERREVRGRGCGGRRARSPRTRTPSRSPSPTTDAGFDPRAGHMGAGFTNMLDRLGALGGSLRVESAEGKGTRVVGSRAGPAPRRLIDRDPAPPGLLQQWCWHYWRRASYGGTLVRIARRTRSISHVRPSPHRR